MTKLLLKLTIAVITAGSIVILILGSLYFSILTQLRSDFTTDECLVLAESTVRNPQEVYIQQYTLPELVYLGEFTITHYCACAECCGVYANGITKTGTIATANWTIAVDPDVIPYGSYVMIRGTIYCAEDCGSAIQGNRIDIYVDDHDEALRLGKYTAEVYLVK